MGNEGGGHKQQSPMVKTARQERERDKLGDANYKGRQKKRLNRKKEVNPGFEPGLPEVEKDPEEVLKIRCDHRYTNRPLGIQLAYFQISCDN